MPTALPSAFSHAQPWDTLKHGSSQVISTNLDDDQQSGSATCEVPDSSGLANEFLTSSGEDQVSIGNDAGPDSGDHSFIEFNPVPPVGLYSSPGLRGTITALPFAKSSADTASAPDNPQGKQPWDEAPHDELHLNRPSDRQQLQPQRPRLMPAIPSAASFNRVPTSKRTPPPRLIALVADVARAAEAAEAAGERPATGKNGRHNNSLGSTLARVSQTSALIFGLNKNPLLYDPSTKLNQQLPNRQDQHSNTTGEQSQSFGLSRSISAAEALLSSTGTRGLPPASEGAPSESTALHPSTSSVLEYRTTLIHSAPPHLQHNHNHQEQQQLRQQQHPLQPAASLGPFVATPRLRATSQGNIRLPVHLPLPPPIPSSHRQQQQPQPQQQQQQSPWWGLTSDTHATLSTDPFGSLPVSSVPEDSGGTTVSPGRRHHPIAISTLPVPSAADTTTDSGSEDSGHTEQSWPQSLPSLTSMLTAQPPEALLLATPSKPQPSKSLPPQLPPSPAPPPQRFISTHLGFRDSGMPPRDLPSRRRQSQEHRLSNTVSAPLLRLSETGLLGGGGGGAAAATAPTETSFPLPMARQLPLAGKAMAAAAMASSGRVVAGGGVGGFRPGRQSAPVLGRSTQLPDLRSAVGGVAAAASAAAAAASVPSGDSGEVHISSVGVLARGANGPPAGEVPSTPEIALRPPRWLKPSAFQVTEQIRSGRLQELADKLSNVSCPTLFDLGGCEFSGMFATAISTAVTAAADSEGPKVPELGPAAAAAAAAATALGAVMSPATHRQQNSHRPSPHAGDQMLSARIRYLKNVPALGSYLQVLAVPPGQHITLANATILLTADQYIFVGPGASLTMKNVEVLGCSREAARQSAAVRRRALSVATAAASAAAAAAPSPSVAAVAAAVAAAPAATAVGSVTSTAATGYSKLVRRSSSPGRTVRDPGMYGVGSTGRRVSIGENLAEGGGAAGGAAGVPGLPALRRRAMSNMGGNAFVLSTGVPFSGQLTAALGAHELVDHNEYVDNHALIEVVGGYARISNCRLWPGRCQLALCVSDGGGCLLSYSTAGACCAAGHKSCLVSEQTTYDGGPAGCVSALDGARMSLTDCMLRYPDGCGGGGGSSEVSDVAPMANCDLGMEARGSGTLAVLMNCDVANGGVAAAHGARLFLQSTRVSDARGNGLTACDSGTALVVRDCRVDDSGGSAIVACDGAAVRVADATLAGSAEGGAVVLPSCSGGGCGAECDDHSGGGNPTAAAASASAMNAAAAATHPISLQPRSTLTLLRCDVSTNAGHGASVTGGGFLAVSDSVLYNNLRCGLSAEGAGSMLSASGSRLIRNDAHGVRVAAGAGAVLARCCATGNSRDGVAVEGQGSRAHLTRCETRENRESGLCVTGGAAVELSYSRLTANQHDGLAIGGTGSTAVAHACVLNGNVAKGAVICMGASAELAECAVHCNGSKSVQVSDDESRLVLGRGCSLDRPPVAVEGGTLVQLREEC